MCERLFARCVARIRKDTITTISEFGCIRLLDNSSIAHCKPIIIDVVIDKKRFQWYAIALPRVVFRVELIFSMHAIIAASGGMCTTAAGATNFWFVFCLDFLVFLYAFWCAEPENDLSFFCSASRFYVICEFQFLEIAHFSWAVIGFNGYW